MKYTTIDDFTEYGKYLIYGAPGTRKTTFASTFPNPVWIDLERSTDTLRHIHAPEGIAVMRPKKMQEIIDIIKDFPKSEFETLVVDTATRLQIFQLAEQMKDMIAKNSSRDKYLPYQADYRRSGALLDELFSALQECDKNVVIIAHQKTFIDEETKRVTAVRPDLTPRLADAVSGLLNCVGYSEVKNNVQIMHFNSFGKVFAKNRLNIQEPITNPTYENCFHTTKKEK